MVIDLQRRLDEYQEKADCERELVTTHRDTAEGEHEAVTQVNYQLLKSLILSQILVLSQFHQNPHNNP